MITIERSCCFASFDKKTGLLTSSIITVDENTTIISGADAAVVNNDVMFCATRTELVSKLKSFSVKESDGSEIVEDVV